MKAIVTALISHFVCSKGLGTTRELVSESLMAWKAASSYNKPAFGTKLIVESEGNGSKISSFLIPWFGTKNRAAQALKREILVNDRRVYQNYLLKEGDTVEFNLRSQSPYDSRGAEIEIETVDTKHIDRVYEFSKILLDDRQNVNPLLILYDDDDCAVVFKPSGVHSLAWTGTLKKNSLALDDVLPGICKHA
jgi:23S rRNA-/tRNA-specific pseudouridylate synthase